MIYWFSFLLYILSLMNALAQSDLTEAQEIAVKSLHETESNISLSKAQIDRLKQQISQLQNDKKQVKANIAVLQKQVKVFKVKLEEAEHLFTIYRTQQALAQSTYDNIAQKFIPIVGALENMQLRPPPILVVKPQTIHELTRGADIINMIMPKMQNKIYEYNKALDRLNYSIKRAKQQNLSLHSTIEQAMLAQEKLNLMLAASNKIELSSKQKIVDTKQNIAILSNKTQALQKFLHIVKQQQNQQNLSNLRQKLPKDFSNFKGKLMLPIKATIVENLYLKQNSLQKGELLLATNDKKVVTPSAAIVVYAGKFRSYGNIVILDMGSNYYMTLIGFGKLCVQRNNFVNKGDLLGYVNDSKTLYVDLKLMSESLNLQSWWAK